jgi:uncharacterized SAM-binding protein YcdF (DUF218 family)
MIERPMQRRQPGERTVGEAMASNEDFDRALVARPGIRRTGVVLLSCAMVAAVLWIELPAILGLAGRLWVVSDPLEPADAIVILGGRVDTRPYAAARLYGTGLASQILVSKGGLSHPERGQREEDDRDVLAKLGVPSAVVKEFGDRPSNTYEEARALAPWAAKNHARRIIIPIEFFASRRVAWIMRRELDGFGVHVMVQAVKPYYALDHWWRDAGARGDFENEAIKYLYYRIRYQRH